MDSNTRRKFSRARRLFPHTKERVYFNSASTGPFSTPVEKAITDLVKMRVAAAKDDSHAGFVALDQLRKDYAGLIGATKRQVGIGANTTHGLNLPIFGLPMKRGDEILVSDVEFPAGVYIVRAAAEARGLKMKFVKSRDRRFDIDALKKSIGPRTRMLVLSFVQFFDGYKNDLKTIGEICRKHGIYFVVDGIQGMGTQTINVRKLGIDVFK